MQKKLAETGVVTVTCTIDDDQIDSAQTAVTLVLNQEKILQMNGEDALHHLYDTYLNK
ncbi:Lipoprotein OS=Lysinibacillus sphaericus OX=1421 GN=LS41612_08455 PE=4 SV=1 [Lysinibacillus sphaericus]